MKKRIPFQAYAKLRHPGARPSSATIGTAMAGLGLIVFSCGANGQAVPLGEAGNYAVISAAGVTNDGFTIVNGNIALSPLTTIVGFSNAIPPSGDGIVNGIVRYNDSQAILAQSDALTAYNTLAGLPFVPANDLTGFDLGGRTLAPGVYHFETSAGLTGNLTLATGADPNAVYVFQIGSTLTTATTSSITVTGAGAATPNIFWQVGSSATLNTGTQFSGNILALASVSMGTGSNLAIGRAIALNGAVTMLTNNISAPAAVLAVDGRFWNGYSTNVWTADNWSSTAAGADRIALGNNADVVFSVNPAPLNQNTVLGGNITISSLTVNDSAPVTIGGNNTLTISAAGLVTGININAGAGLTTISANLRLGNLSQVVAVNNADGMLISGVVSGTNGLTKAGNGRLTLTNAQAYTGATVVSNGTLQLGDGVTTGTAITSPDAILIAPNGVLSINLANGESFGNRVTDNGRIEWIAQGRNTQAPGSVFSGTGDMLVTAPTTTVLLGNNTFTGDTTIDTPGNVLVGNPITNTSSPFGRGTLILDNGTIDTVNSQLLQIGTGGYTQTGGEISMHLQGTNPGDYTRFVVAGNAAISGGTVSVYDLSGNYVPQGGDTQNIITTTGSRTGTFANDPEARFFSAARGRDILYRQGDTLLYPTLTYDPANVTVTWVQDSFRSVPGLTPNQDAVGGGLDGAGVPPAIIDFLNGENVNNLPPMFSLIAPDELTAIFKMGFAASEIQNANIRRHLDRVRQGSTSEGQETYSTTDSKGGMVEQTRMSEQNNLWSVFIEGNGGSASVDGDLNSNGYDFDSMGVTVGADRRVSENFAIGVLGAYGKSDAALTNGGSIDAESYKGAVYATAFQGGFFVDALLGAGANSYDTRRASLGGLATGSPDGWELNAMVNTGYDFRSGNWTFTPTASIAYTRVNLDAFNETGSLTPLSYPDQHQESLRSEIGARLAYRADLGGVVLMPQIRLAWQHEFSDSTLSMNSNFIGGAGPGFTVTGPQMDRDRAVISAGLSAQVTPTVCIYGFYDGHLGSSDYESNQVSAGVKVDF